MKYDQKHFADSDELCRYVADYQNGCTFLMFSLGIDSLACWLFMRKYFKKIVPVYMYTVPNLEFVDRALNYYEQWFGKKILRIPHAKTIKALSEGLFQFKPTKRMPTVFQNYDMDTMLVYVARAIGYPENMMAAIGNKKADNPIRYMSITKDGSINYKRSVYYPIFDFKEGDVRDIIRESGIKIPIDYKIFGRSFDGLVYRFMKPLKEHYPNDYAKIKEYFPLLDVELIRTQI